MRWHWATARLVRARSSSPPWPRTIGKHCWRRSSAWGACPTPRPSQSSAIVTIVLACSKSKLNDLHRVRLAKAYGSPVTALPAPWNLAHVRTNTLSGVLEKSAPREGRTYWCITSGTLIILLKSKRTQYTIWRLYSPFVYCKTWKS